MHGALGASLGPLTLIQSGLLTSGNITEPDVIRIRASTFGFPAELLYNPQNSFAITEDSVLFPTRFGIRIATVRKALLSR